MQTTVKYVLQVEMRRKLRPSKSHKVKIREHAFQSNPRNQKDIPNKLGSFLADLMPG